VLRQLIPRNSVAEAVGILKGATSRVIHKEFSGIEEFL